MRKKELRRVKATFEQQNQRSPQHAVILRSERSYHPRALQFSSKSPIVNILCIRDHQSPRSDSQYPGMPKVSPKLRADSNTRVGSFSAPIPRPVCATNALGVRYRNSHFLSLTDRLK